MGLTTWWAWWAAAILLGILEMLVPAYVFLGFAAGAFGTGALLLIGGAPGGWLASNPSALLLIFAVLSVIAWVVLRLVLGVRKNQVKIIEDDINDR